VVRDFLGLVELQVGERVGGAFVNNTPDIGGRKPLPINVEAGKSYWWCACGRSQAQPFCDGSHKGTPFAPSEWKPEATGEVWFCTCKRTTTPPLCDGSHKKLPAK
jgi:CDGSH-type Zn-finger protein